ncbi:acetylcholinesterase [Moniliophthora roreri MCA 2997]|uniref:Carboxylic ester hydrolase n=1 Tax=Moniliophthora roreri (strain MCA 2997) TaxID=1381753 RepID=V2XM64_MONRO|nr:acetylcholinesterase [Moniliophthora roreri MCA 2997]
MGNVLAPYKSERHALIVGHLGTIEGLTLSRAETGEALVKRYLNVPFVLPPTGPYRWRRPRPLPPDRSYYSLPDGSPLDCTVFGHTCPQPEYTKLGNHEFSKYDEDCLTLNIWTPAGTPPEGGWPVMLWFHGGWLQVGDPSIDPNMDPTELIAVSGGGLQCVFVAAAYRLSVFGFMASKELAEEAEKNGEKTFGNYGLWDQDAALDWVHKHIHHFGGNPNELTLSGRSAGAYSTHAIAAHDFLMNPTGPSRYKRLVMYSNAIPADPKSLDDVQPQFDELLDVCNISYSLPGQEKLAALRAIPALELIDKIMTLSAHTFRPIRDGHFFPLDLFDRFTAGDFAKEFKRRGLQVLLGEVRDEETLYRQTNPPHDLESLYTEVGNYYSPSVTRMMVDAYLNRKVHKDSARPDPDPNIDPWKKVFGDIISDGQVRAPARLLVRQLHGAGVPLSSIRRYMINWRPSFVNARAPKEFGVSHALDKPIWNFSIMHGPTPDEELTMRAWIKDLVDFVHGRQTDYGTRHCNEHKVLRPDGTIAVEKDEKWDYLIAVADEMCTAK